MGVIWVIIFVATFANHSIVALSVPSHGADISDFEKCDAVGTPIWSKIKEDNPEIAKLTFFCIPQPDADQDKGA